MGEIEQILARDAMRAGEPLPERIANAPELQDDLVMYYNAFFELDTERNHSMGPMPIPFTSIVKYAELFEFDERQTESLIYYIRAMDKEQLKRVAKAQGNSNGESERFGGEDGRTSGPRSDSGE